MARRSEILNACILFLDRHPFPLFFYASSRPLVLSRDACESRMLIPVMLHVLPQSLECEDKIPVSYIEGIWRWSTKPGEGSTQPVPRPSQLKERLEELQDGKIKEALLELAEIAAERKRKRREESERQSAAKLARMADIPTISLTHSHTDVEAASAASLSSSSTAAVAAAATSDKEASSQAATQSLSPSQPHATEQEDAPAAQASAGSTKDKDAGTPGHHLVLTSPTMLTPGQSVALTPNCAAALAATTSNADDAADGAPAINPLKMHL
jgi:hypothetical protein